MYINNLKRKLRELKKFEKRIRFPESESNRKEDYVWNHFFSTKTIQNTDVRYSLDYLLKSDHKVRKDIFEEFFFHIYLTLFRQTGLQLFDSELLSELGLFPSAGMEEIKKRFRELARKHHPDVGGDHEKMIKLIDTYNRLIKKA